MLNERQTAWLVEFPESGDSYEHGKRIGPAIPRHWLKIGKGRATDPNDAMRFSRKIDAEEMIRRIDNAPFAFRPSGAFASEHIWVADASPADDVVERDAEEVLRIACKMHNAWMRRDDLMRQPNGGFAMLEQAADLLDEIVDEVPALNRAVMRAYARRSPPEAAPVDHDDGCAINSGCTCGAARKRQSDKGAVLERTARVAKNIARVIADRARP